jgi:hypothetical protein
MGLTSVLYNISNLINRVDNLFGLPGIDLPMLAAFSRFSHKPQTGVMNEQKVEYLQSYSKTTHYNENIRAILSFILDARDLSLQPEQQPSLGLRIALDVEKLIADTRSLLSALYELALLYDTSRSTRQAT